MTNGYHAVIWINHAEAKICRFSANQESEVDLHSHTSLQGLHHSRTGWYLPAGVAPSPSRLSALMPPRPSATRSAFGPANSQPCVPRLGRRACGSGPD